MRVDGSSPNFYDMTRSLRETFDSIQRQMATGQKANAFGELGTRTQPWLDYAQSASQADAYRASIAQHGNRLKLIDGTLSGLIKTAQSASSLLNGGLETFKSGQTVARNAFAMFSDLLNTQNGTVPLFGGGARVHPAILSGDAMLDGDGSQVGLRTLINERIAAETGGEHLGRLAITSAASSVTLTQSGGAFGYSIIGAQASVTGLNTNIAAGPPRAMTISSSVSFAQGDTITMTLGLPDGSQQSVTVEYGADGLAPGPFNGAALANAISAKLATLTPALKTATAIRVATDYFAGTMSRVAGASASTATSLAPAETVSWYKGTQASDPRQSSRAQISEGQAVGVGVQANEPAFTRPLAAIAAATVLLEDPTLQTQEGRAALQATILPKLAPEAFQSLQVEFGMIQKQLDDAQAVQTSIKTLADNFLLKENRADPTELSAQLLALQNQLQASYQAGARILKLTLTDYI